MYTHVNMYKSTFRMVQVSADLYLYVPADAMHAYVYRYVQMCIDIDRILP